MTQRLEKSRKRKSDDVEKDEIDEETNEIPIRIRKGQTKKKPKAEQERAIQVGDTVDLSELLFTKERDFLVKYNQNQQVKAEELAGKVVVLHFVSLVHGSFFWSKLVTHLSDIYSKLHPTGSFEIVFVAVRDDICCKGMPVGSTPRKRFLERFSTMAWPAIPFSDLKSRKHLERIFGISNPVDLMPRSFIIDPRGVVLQCGGNSLFFRYGAAGYPFTHEMIDLLDYKDYAAKFEPSVTNLLASSERDYVITNKGDQVPLRNLENKVVGLYFCPDLNNKRTTMKLKMAYEELSRYTEGFEVVLIYTHGWWNTYGRKDEDSFRKAFGKMPWLALPYEDTDCNRKLQRIFEYPQELVGTKPDSTLVIIGPNGKFFEPLGANILLEYGVSAYPFTLFDAADLELEMVSKVKPEMFWDLDAVFTRRNGSEVRFSQLVGKRIIVLFQSRMSKLDCTLRELESRYLKMKGTDDEFEVIHIYDGCDAAAMPWLMHPPFVRDSHAQKLVDRVFHGFYTHLCSKYILDSSRLSDSLKYTSALSVGLAVVFVVITAGVAILKSMNGSIGMPRLLPQLDDQASFWKLFTTVPILVTAYICHHNIHPIQNELKDPMKMKSIVKTSVVFCSSVYITTSFFGFLLFGDQTLDDILANFDGDLGIPYGSMLNDLVRVSYGIHVMLVFPIVFYSLRLNLDGLIFPHAIPLIYDNQRFFSVTTALMGFIYMGANFVPSIWDAFQFTGATATVAVGYIFRQQLLLGMLMEMKQRETN